MGKPPRVPRYAMYVKRGSVSGKIELLENVPRFHGNSGGKNGSEPARQEVMSPVNIRAFIIRRLLESIGQLHHGRFNWLNQFSRRAFDDTQPTHAEHTTEDARPSLITFVSRSRRKATFEFRILKSESYTF